MQNVSLNLLVTTLSSRNGLALTSGSPAHIPGLNFTAELLPITQDSDVIEGLVDHLLPSDYGGDLREEVPRMVSDGLAKGLHLKGRLSAEIHYDPGDIGPVPMGYLDDGRYVFMDKKRSILIAETSNRITNLQTLMNLAPLQFWQEQFPQFKGGRVIGVNSLVAGDVLMEECRALGGFDPSKVRGRGVFLDDGRVIVNYGQPIPKDVQHSYVCHLGLNINLETTTEYNSDDVYSLFRKFKWASPSASYLLFGWTVTAVIGGALDWRPHIFITGSKNTGKSTLIGILGHVLGPIAIILDGTSTEAGIRQKIGPDARPVILDEFEADSNIPRMKNIVKLARSASSATGQIARGTPEGKALEFNIQSNFLFGAITPMAVTAADRSRIVVLSLEKHDNDRAIAEEITRQTEKIVGCAADWCGQAIQQVGNIRASIATLRRCAPPGDSRHILNMATLLAGAFCMLHKKEITEDEARALLDEHAAVITELSAAHEGDDASDCLNTLLEFRLRDDFLLGNLMAHLKRERLGTAEDRARYERKLASYGIRFDGQGYLVANAHRGLSEVFRGTIWEAGGWNTSLRRLPGAEKTKQKRFGDQRIEAVWLPKSAIPEEYDDGGTLPIDHF